MRFYRKLLVLLILLPLLDNRIQAQDSSRSRKWIVAGGHAAAWTGSFFALNKAWYADYKRTNFHFFNDGKEWSQLDKAGHVWTAYQLGRASAATWKWAGYTDRKSAWLGAASAVAFQSIVEIQDGFSDKWGFSNWDMIANIGGAAIFLGQELGWKEQRITIKMGYYPYRYPTELMARRDELFGKGALERILKDYNSQTYWLSGNIKSFLPNVPLPKWLNFSVGYGSDLLLGGMENSWLNDQQETIDRTDIKRIRRYYLSADIDLTRIPTRSKTLRTIFFLFNSIKIPAPALEWNTENGFRGHWLHE